MMKAMVYGMSCRGIIIFLALLYASQIISGYKDEKIEILEQTDLIRIYANSVKVYAVTNKGEYILRLRLYEIENRLPCEIKEGKLYE